MPPPTAPASTGGFFDSFAPSAVDLPHSNVVDGSTHNTHWGGSQGILQETPAPAGHAHKMSFFDDTAALSAANDAAGAGDSCAHDGGLGPTDGLTSTTAAYSAPSQLGTETCAQEGWGGGGNTYACPNAHGSSSYAAGATDASVFDQGFGQDCAPSDGSQHPGEVGCAAVAETGWGGATEHDTHVTHPMQTAGDVPSFFGPQSAGTASGEQEMQHSGHSVQQGHAEYQGYCQGHGEYGQGHYAQGDYGRGHYAQGDYGQGHYAQGDYAQGEHAQEQGTQDAAFGSSFGEQQQAPDVQGEPYWYEEWGCWVSACSLFYHDEASGTWQAIPGQQVEVAQVAEDASACTLDASHSQASVHTAGAEHSTGASHHLTPLDLPQSHVHAPGSSASEKVSPSSSRVINAGATHYEADQPQDAVSQIHSLAPGPQQQGTFPLFADDQNAVGHPAVPSPYWPAAQEQGNATSYVSQQAHAGLWQPQQPSVAAAPSGPVPMVPAVPQYMPTYPQQVSLEAPNLHQVPVSCLRVASCWMFGASTKECVLQAMSGQPDLPTGAPHAGAPAPYSATAPQVPQSAAAPRSVNDAMYSNAGTPPRAFVSFGVGGRCCVHKPSPPTAGYGNSVSDGQTETTGITDVASLPKVLQSGSADMPAAAISGKKDSWPSSFRAKEAHPTSNLLRDWPGPMATSTPAGKQIATATEARAKACEAAGQVGHALIWRLLGVMAKNKGTTVDGAVKGAQPEADILQLLKSSLDLMGATSTAEDIVQQINSWVAHDSSTACLCNIEDLLVSGRRSEALDAAKAAKVRPSLMCFPVTACVCQRGVHRRFARFGAIPCTVSYFAREV